MTIGEIYTLIHNGNKILERLTDADNEISLSLYEIESWADVITDLITTIKDMEV